MLNVLDAVAKILFVRGVKYLSSNMVSCANCTVVLNLFVIRIWIRVLRVLHFLFQEQIKTSHGGLSSIPNRPQLYIHEGMQTHGYHARMPTSHHMSGPPYAGHYDSVMVGGSAMLPPGMSPQQHQQMMMSGGWSPDFYRAPGPVATSNRMMYPLAVRGPPSAPVSYTHLTLPTKRIV